MIYMLLFRGMFELEKDIVHENMAKIEGLSVYIRMHEEHQDILLL